MGFQKGNNFGQGRPKGSKNKATRELREFVNEFINDNKDKVQNDFDSLEPKERIDTLIKLMEYSLPKLNRTELTADLVNDVKAFDINELYKGTDQKSGLE